MDHLAPVVRVHGVLVLVLLAGQGIRGRKSGIVAICKVELDQGVCPAQLARHRPGPCTPAV